MQVSATSAGKWSGARKGGLGRMRPSRPTFRIVVLEKRRRFRTGEGTCRYAYAL
jgi:hypothetical protein